MEDDLLVAGQEREERIRRLVEGLRGQVHGRDDVGALKVGSAHVDDEERVGLRGDDERVQLGDANLVGGAHWLGERGVP